MSCFIILGRRWGGQGWKKRRNWRKEDNRSQWNWGVCRWSHGYYSVMYYGYYTSHFVWFTAEHLFPRSAANRSPIFSLNIWFCFYQVELLKNISIIIIWLIRRRSNNNNDENYVLLLLIIRIHILYIYCAFLGTPRHFTKTLHSSFIQQI